MLSIIRVVEVGIKKWCRSINVCHAQLVELLRHRIGDPRMLWLIGVF